MNDFALLSNDTELQTLHERVNAMLDIPVPKEGDAFPLPVEVAVDETPLHGGVGGATVGN